MKKLFLASILSMGALCATEGSMPDEKNIWDERGGYVKYGIGVDVAVPNPLLLSLGFGYYWSLRERAAIDLSAMVNIGFEEGVLDVKLLLLPVLTKKFQFGIGLVYLKDVGFYLDVDSLGGAVLFRKVSLESKNFFQVEISQALFLLHGRGLGAWGDDKRPRVNIMFGRRF